MLENILIYSILACVFIVAFMPCKKNSVIGEEVDRKSDAVLQRIGSKFMLVEKQ